jgi:hypothetical protein
VPPLRKPTQARISHPQIHVTRRKFERHDEGVWAPVVAPCNHQNSSACMPHALALQVTRDSICPKRLQMPLLMPSKNPFGWRTTRTREIHRRNLLLVWLPKRITIITAILRMHFGVRRAVQRTKLTCGLSYVTIGAGQLGTSNPLSLDSGLVTILLPLFT